MLKNASESNLILKQNVVTRSADSSDPKVVIRRIVELINVGLSVVALDNDGILGADGCNCLNNHHVIVIKVSRE